MPRFKKDRRTAQMNCRLTLACVGCGPDRTCSVRNRSLYLRRLLILPVRACSAQCPGGALACQRPHNVSRNSNGGRRRRRQLIRPCDPVMSCHDVRLRQVISRDHLSGWDFTRKAPVVACDRRCRYEEMEDRREGKGRSDGDGGQRLGQADVDSAGSSGPLGNLRLFIVSAIKPEGLRGLTQTSFLSRPKRKPASLI